MNYVIYQAYGKLEILQECLFSMATLWEYIGSVENLTIIVFTDQTAWFTSQVGDNKSVVLVSITPEQIRQWRGSIDFVHRVKIEILLQVATSFAGNILYLDTDTFWLASPEPLFAAIASGKKVMHLQEDILSKSKLLLNKKVYRYIRGKTFTLPSKPVAIAGHLGMWNAGVLGFRTQDVGTLVEVLQLTDLLYAGYGKHTMEQLAFSVMFQQSGEVLPADNIAFHYWDFKEFREVLSEFWAKNASLDWKAKSKLASSIKPTEKILQKRAFQLKPYWLRKLFQWAGKTNLNTHS